MSYDSGFMRSEFRILRENRYDHLTGLPNLAYFFELGETTKQAATGGEKYAVVVYLDLNGMKNYNHRKGFAEGDKLLIAFAGVLGKAFGPDRCCHIGADRFAAFALEDGVEDTLNRLFRDAAEMNGGNTLPVRAGIYSTRFGDVPITSSFDRAKIACDEIRRTNKSEFQYYSAELSEKYKRRDYILGNIDRAIEERWIQVYYQPIVRAVNARVCDEEALARWIDPEKGFLSPAEFIPTLEESGLIYKLDLYMLERVLEKMHDQKRKDLHLVPHSINLSRSDFENRDIVEEIRKRVDAAGIDRGLITIEITESVIGRDFDFMKEQIGRFRALGFPVWMDDFGSGYSSIDVLQSIRFDLIKFDMSFMRKLDQGDAGKIVLTELMKMTTSLGLDTVCEGVETEDQVRFLQEIGCSKLQGFYFCRPIPYEQILERYRTGKQIGFEDPKTSAYYETIGRINLYDLSVIAGGEGDSFQNTFNTLPMGIIEVKGDEARFVRSNPSYRTFLERYFKIRMTDMTGEFRTFSATFTRNIARICGERGNRALLDENMPDGTVVHSFARRIGTNPLTGTTAVAVAVLSISKPDGDASYAQIARALASDYYNIYAVELDSENYIEYTSPMGRDELAMERHGTDFFESARRDTMTRIYDEDREMFLAWFTKENIVRELDEHGVFTATYRLVDTGKPIYVSMKITRMQNMNRIILGVSVIDAQMKQRLQAEKARQERDALARAMAIAEDYMVLYSVNPDTGQYVEYTSTEEYAALGLVKEGDDFFARVIEDGNLVVHPEDLEKFRDGVTKENILQEIREKGEFRLHYRLVLQGEPRYATLKIVPFSEGNEVRLLAGVRTWKIPGQDASHSG